MNLDLIFESQEVRLACAGYLLLSEAIQISDEEAKKYADYIKRWDKAKYRQWFGDEERIIVPFSKSDEELKNIPIPYNVKIAMDVLGYKIVSYYDGTCTKDGGKNIEKIGRVLARNQQKLLDNDFTMVDVENPKTGKITKMLGVLRTIETDRNRGGGDELVLVISRHPLDIAKMSEDRPWQNSSCMRMGTGQHRHVFCDIDEGTLIAYVTKSSDKDLEKPIGRVLIKPYINQDDPNDIMLVNTRLAYGGNPPGFMRAVDSWIASVQPDKKGVFRINPKLYHDRPEHGEGQGEGAPEQLINVDPDDEEAIKNMSPEEAYELAKHLGRGKVTPIIIDIISYSRTFSLQFVRFVWKSVHGIPEKIYKTILKSPTTTMQLMISSGSKDALTEEALLSILRDSDEARRLAIWLVSDLEETIEDVDERILKALPPTMAAGVLQQALSNDSGQEIPEWFLKQALTNPKAATDFLESYHDSEKAWNSYKWLREVVYMSPVQSHYWAVKFKDGKHIGELAEAVSKSSDMSLDLIETFDLKSGEIFDKLVHGVAHGSSDASPNRRSNNLVRLARIMGWLKHSDMPKEFIHIIAQDSLASYNYATLSEDPVPDEIVDAIAKSSTRASNYAQHLDWTNLPDSIMRSVVAGDYNASDTLKIAMSMGDKKVPDYVIDRLMEYPRAAVVYAGSQDWKIDPRLLKHLKDRGLTPKES